MKRFGFNLSTLPGPLHTQRRAVEELEALGYTDLWTSESYVVDAFSPLLLASVWAPTMRLGTAVVPVFTRGPALLAMSVAALCQAAPGRVAIGLGASSRTIVERWNAIPFEKPLARVRDTADFLRAALSGERVDECLETFSVDRFRLAARVETPPRILLGAVRPRMLELSRSFDGAILNFIAPQDAQRILPLVMRDDGESEIAALLPTTSVPDLHEARAQARPLLNEYLNVPGYASAQRWLGRAGSLEETWRCWKAGDRRGAASAIPDSVVDNLVVHGSPEGCRVRVDQYVASGIATPIIDPLPGSDPMQVARDLAPR